MSPFPETFGSNPFIVTMIAATALLYVALRVSAWWLRPPKTAQAIVRR